MAHDGATWRDHRLAGVAGPRRGNERSGGSPATLPGSTIVSTHRGLHDGASPQIRVFVVVETRARPVRGQGEAVPQARRSFYTIRAPAEGGSDAGLLRPRRARVGCG